MKRSAVVVALIVFLLGVGACGGGGTTGGRGSVSSPSRIATDPGTVLTQDFGRVGLAVFSSALEKIVIVRYKFSLRRREEQYQSLYYETLWVPRSSTEEERASGILEARHRVVMRGRRAGSNAQQSNAVAFRMSLKIENQTRTREDPDWHGAAVSGGSLEGDMRQMVSDFQAEVRAGGTIELE